MQAEGAGSTSYCLVAGHACRVCAATSKLMQTHFKNFRSMKILFLQNLAKSEFRGKEFCPASRFRSSQPRHCFWSLSSERRMLYSMSSCLVKNNFVLDKNPESSLFCKMRWDLAPVAEQVVKLQDVLHLEARYQNRRWRKRSEKRLRVRNSGLCQADGHCAASASGYQCRRCGSRGMRPNYRRSKPGFSSVF